jgi:hypothetical protein
LVTSTVVKGVWTACFFAAPFEPFTGGQSKFPAIVKLPPSSASHKVFIDYFIFILAGLGLAIINAVLLSPLINEFKSFIIIFEFLFGWRSDSRKAWFIFIRFCVGICL